MVVLCLSASPPTLILRQRWGDSAWLFFSSLIGAGSLASLLELSSALDTRLGERAQLLFFLCFFVPSHSSIFREPGTRETNV